MRNYKLTYFDGRGLAEVARILFVAGGVEFEDIRMERESWPEVKKETPFGQVPMLEVDGVKYGQSVAIYNFVARETGFYGKDNKENLGIDQVVHLVSDFRAAGSKIMRETDETKKAELVKIFCEEDAPKYFGYLVKLLKDSTSGYFVGSSLTLADILVFEFVTAMEKRFPAAVKIPAEVEALCKKVLENEKIKAHCDNRKDTPF